MRISELTRRSGIPLATVKYYMRDGLLMGGESTGATQARYSEKHLDRLSLVRTLVEVAGLPLAKVKAVLAVVDEPGPSVFDAIGAAISALPPDVPTMPEYPRARKALEALGQVYDPDFTAVAQLDAALAGLETAGRPLSDELLQLFGRHIRAIAAAELDEMRQWIEKAGYETRSEIEAAVVGTILREPLIAALRRLAHQDIYLAGTKRVARKDAANKPGPKRVARTTAR